MDYSDDICLYEFTEDQFDRMVVQWNLYRNGPSELTGTDCSVEASPDDFCMQLPGSSYCSPSMCDLSTGFCVPGPDPCPGADEVCAGEACETIPPPTSVVDATGVSGGRNEETFYGPFSAPSDGTFFVTTSGGTGDVDLYVGAGGIRLSKNRYTCASFTSSNSEACQVSVSSGEPVEFMLKGWTAYAGVDVKAWFAA